ncbi:unnamed protein product [Clonostachys byssicola]|uniref:Uncharacterized protein n=1 Tax=Clonostachys byssicola TaxID=160290 RepID=A0A9N9U9Z7_9HYPO|nr:unnamed protein product [Clonostachys byssicola]
MKPEASDEFSAKGQVSGDQPSAEIAPGNADSSTAETAPDGQDNTGWSTAESTPDGLQDLIWMVKIPFPGLVGKA